MKINYFDLGVFDGRQIDWMIDIIFPDLGITDYAVYGIEANKSTCEFLTIKYKSDNRITIHHKAIANENKIGNLYPGYRKSGRRPNSDSIFVDKHNVKKEPSEQVEFIIFSDWLKQTIPDLGSNFNILKWNIEGAELYLVEDIIKNNLVNVFDIYCGSKSDLPKIKSMAKHDNRYEKLLKGNNIDKFWFAGSSAEYRIKSINNMKRSIRGV